MARVAWRVQQGGHHVPEDVVRRRFAASHRNFEEIYKPLADEWFLLDNRTEEPIIIESGVFS